VGQRHWQVRDAHAGLPMTLEELRRILEKAWSEDTAGGDRWDPKHPSLNQCAVTALVVQDFFGGELLRCAMTNGDSHYWNMLPTGQEADLTMDQFDVADGLPVYDTLIIRPRQYLFQAPGTIRRYGLLVYRVSAVMEDKL